MCECKSGDDQGLDYLGKTNDQLNEMSLDELMNELEVVGDRILARCRTINKKLIRL